MSENGEKKAERCVVRSSWFVVYILGGCPSQYPGTSSHPSRFYFLELSLDDLTKADSGERSEPLLSGVHQPSRALGSRPATVALHSDVQKFPARTDVRTDTTRLSSTSSFLTTAAPSVCVLQNRHPYRLASSCGMTFSLRTDFQPQASGLRTQTMMTPRTMKPLKKKARVSPIFGM